MWIFGWMDLAAVLVFLCGWLLYSWINDSSPLRRHSLSFLMNEQRHRWMDVMASREFRMIDTSIMSGLQQGTAFFASSCIFVIGGCFALLGSAERVAAISADLPFHGLLDKTLVETKLLGLVAIFAFAFFKFGWAYRLFNYCTILIGAVPMTSAIEADPVPGRGAVERAAMMNRLAGLHFNAGLRAIFFGIAYLGWFVGPVFLVLTTMLTVVILAKRQYFSPARAVVAHPGAAPHLTRRESAKTGGGGF
ncbi:DUF599 domain-containing protein [Consotaella salsifontis]|uniref:Uncharacterized membrane protein n=1 Tax=Consotaella salsifontis TaxID=1365950 RepID=A0A1T4SZ32_9HYPH|nr:DUF599 family protein [Consotaella salsifontis]SKA33490.1 Uncharacterized membrane protein [Consotaella salsifontis]